MGFLDNPFSGKKIKTTMDKKTAVEAIKQHYEESGSKVSLCRMGRYDLYEVTNPNKVELIRIDFGDKTPGISFTIYVKGKKTKATLLPHVVDKNAQKGIIRPIAMVSFFLGGIYAARQTMMYGLSFVEDFLPFDGYLFLLTMLIAMIVLFVSPFFFVLVVGMQIFNKFHYHPDTGKTNQIIREFEFFIYQKEHEFGELHE